MSFARIRYLLKFYMYLAQCTCFSTGRPSREQNAVDFVHDIRPTTFYLGLLNC